MAGANNMEGQIYTFKITLLKNIHRTIEVEGASSLHQFAKAIVSAYGFQFDHPFGFYSSERDIHSSHGEAYTLFCDEGGRIAKNEKSVKKSHVLEVFAPKKKMVFLFDYGDEWMFSVECLCVAGREAGKVYPIVTKEKGEAPKQYEGVSDYEEDDDDDEGVSDDE